MLNMPNYQIPQGTSPFGRASPFLIVGIILFVIPFFKAAVKGLLWLPDWLKGIGVLFVVIGIIHSIVRGIDNG